MIAESIKWKGTRFYAAALDYWNTYLWHHRHPTTRLLHRIGSWVSLAGLAAPFVGLPWQVLPFCIFLGYGFAFSGHYLVERNRPLTLKSPIRAGVCNWILFFYEMFFDVETKLRELERLNLDTSEMNSV